MGRMNSPLDAILLLGPTGAGKTPLGQLFQANGRRSRRCWHFDFGDQLRQLVERDRPDERVSRGDLDFLQRVLDTGALLEDEDFPLAERILQAFLAGNEVRPDDWIVLNGLPRHRGQAERLTTVAVRELILLECDAETVRRRIAANVGGDRAERRDDDPARIERKLKLFQQRTQPLVEYYKNKGVPITRLVVTDRMTATDMYDRLSD